jgi:pimeloyl-ACP methyl ester carboxylesterase
MKDILHLSHANGFPGGSYDTIAGFLAPHYDVRHTDRFGHNPLFPVTDNWPHLERELIHYFETNYQQPVIAVGHSLGGVLSMMVAFKRPDLVKAFVMLDSPLLTTVQARGLQFAKRFGLIERFMPIRRTEERRTEWASFDEATAYFRSKLLMKRFDERCLVDYVKAGTEAFEGGLRLRFSPEVEASIWRSIPHTLRAISNLSVPGAVIGGRDSDIFRRVNGAHMQSRLNMRVRWLPGGHMFPFEYPEETAEQIHQLVREMLG